jgi:hypothetical protein
MMLAVQMVSGGMIYRPGFMTIGTGVHAILRLRFNNFIGFQCWYYRWEGFMSYAVKMASSGIIYL